MAGTGDDARLVGRQRELALLLGAAEDTERGRSGVVLVEAEAGLGKTRLLHELAARLRSEEDGSRTHLAVGHGVDLSGGHIPYGVAAGILGQLVRHAGPEGVETLTRRSRAALAVLHPPLGDVPDGAALDRLALVAGFTELVAHLGRTASICLVVEDVHWADAPSLDLLSLLAAAPPTPRFLLVGTHRPLDAGAGRAAQFVADLVASGRAQFLVLGPLTDAEVGEHVRRLRGGSIPPDRVAEIVALAQGVPLFLQALVQDADVTGDRLPSTITASVAARVLSLPEPARRVVEAAAVRGLPTDRTALAGVTGLEDDVVRDATHRAVGLRLLDLVGGGRVRVQHAIVGRAVEEALDDLTRESWHRSWATWLEGRPHTDAAVASSLAHHWYHAGDADRALASGVRAAGSATELEATQEAALHFARALELWERVQDPEVLAGMDRDTLVVALYWAHRAAGDAGSSDALIARELTATPRPTGTRVLWLELRRYLRPVPAGAGIPPRAVGSLPWSEVLDLARRVLDGPPPDPSPMLLGTLATLLNRALPVDVERLVGDLVARLAPSLVDHPKLGVLALHAHGYLLLRQRRYEDALLREREAEQATDEVGPRERQRATANVVSSLVTLGRVGEAVQHGERALARLGTVGAARAEWISLAQNVIVARVHAGGWQRAAELYAVHLEHVQWWPVGESAGAMAQVCAWQGRREACREAIALCAEDFGPLDSESEPTSYLHLPHLGAALLAESVGDLSTAREQLRPLVSSARLVEDSGVLWSVVVTAAGLTPVGGATDRDRLAWSRLVRESADRVDRVGDLGEAWSAEVDAQLARAAGEDDPDGWSEVASRWESLGFVHREALARILVADRLARGRRQGSGLDTRRAREELVCAQQLLEPLGAEPALLRVQQVAARARLRVPSGAQPGAPAEQPALSGLTAREMEVAGLIALGRTNQQIAAELFMSPKTASVHVSRIIMKLGTQNRTEVAALLHREGLISR